MRWRYVVILIALAGCSSPPELPTINAPWDPVEPQSVDPVQPKEAGLPAWERIGNSVRGKPIEAVTLGSGPRRVYVVGGLHGDEQEGPALAARLPAALQADLTGDSGAGLTVRILRDGNPDGTALNQRGNTRGTDLNRNFPARDFSPKSLPGRLQGRAAASELEVDAVLKDLRVFKPDVVLVLRTAAMGRGPQVAFDGPGGGMSLAYDLASAARGVDPRWRVSADKTFVSPGSIDSLVARDMGKPVLSVELRRGGELAENTKALRAGITAMAPKVSGTRAGPARGSEAPPVKEPVLGGRP